MTSETKLIMLTQGQAAIVDASDYEHLSKHKWYAQRTVLGTFYAVRQLARNNGKQPVARMHRVIIDAPEEMHVDHINHNTLDNRRSNLRLCTNGENKKNSRSAKGSTSKYLGVGWDRHANKWEALIRVNGKQSRIGRFSCEVEAAKAYDAAARKHHGEFANPNFKED